MPDSTSSHCLFGEQGLLAVLNALCLWSQEDPRKEILAFCGDLPGSCHCSLQGTLDNHTGVRLGSLRTLTYNPSLVSVF